MEYVTTAVGALKLLPEIVEIGKTIWKKLKSPEELAVRKGPDGVFGKTYYSGQYGFTISIPDDNWQFWKPSPQFVASFGILLAWPTRELTIMVLSKQMVRLFRPFVNVVVEDVGSLTNVNEIVNLTKHLLTSQGIRIDEDKIHISSNTNSAILIGTQPYSPGLTIYQVQQIYLYASRVYYVTASYVPVSDESPSMFGGLQDVVNSFQLIKETKLVE